MVLGNCLLIGMYCAAWNSAFVSSKCRRRGVNLVNPQANHSPLPGLVLKYFCTLLVLIKYLRLFLTWIVISSTFLFNLPPKEHSSDKGSTLDSESPSTKKGVCLSFVVSRVLTFKFQREMQKAKKPIELQICPLIKGDRDLDSIPEYSTQAGGNMWTIEPKIQLHLAKLKPHVSFSCAREQWH